jgi:RHS repeat-associated protein
MSREIKRRFPSDIAHPIVAGWPIYDQAIQYTGHISDSWEHGPNFNYMRSRYQEQATSRFLSRDTWTGRDGRPQSKNRYAYAEGNPASRVDPSGRCPQGFQSDPFCQRAQGYASAMATRPEAGGPYRAHSSGVTAREWRHEGKLLGYYVPELDVFVAENIGDLCPGACFFGNRLIAAGGRMELGGAAFWHEVGHVLQGRTWFPCEGSCDYFNHVFFQWYRDVFEYLRTKVYGGNVSLVQDFHPAELNAHLFGICVERTHSQDACASQATAPERQPWPPGVPE